MVVASAVGLVVLVGNVAVYKWSDRCRTKALNGALKAYLDAAKAGERACQIFCVRESNMGVVWGC